MRGWTRALLVCALAIAAAVGVQGAVADSPSGAQVPSNIGGVVPVLSGGTETPSPALGGGNLLYHGGKVMRANTAYAIFWLPAGQMMSSSYRTLIKTYFKDVALDSGKTSNVYFAATQYFDGTGHIAYNSRFGGAVVMTNPFPVNGCIDPATVTCLSDSQLRAEVNLAISQKLWTRTPKHAFFIFTPKNVGSCFGLGPSGCAYTDYCAYHGAEGSGSSILIYANQPYAAHAGCDVGQRPNGNDADPTINVVSHEHNEAITDPDVSTGWYDNQGFENGDKCVWIFGSLQGPAGAQYNQTINLHHYLLQEEWSNQGSHCVQTGL